MAKRNLAVVTIKLSTVAVILFTLVVVFIIGIQIGLWKGRKLERQDMSTRFTEAIVSGKSQTIGDFVLTPDKKWCPDNPVTFIWPRKGPMYYLLGVPFENEVGQ